MTAKILVVDDSATDRIIIKNMLRDYDISTASDGLEAMRCIDTNADIDLIILDLKMPNMDGFQVLEKLKSSDQYQKLRTIILTNYDEIDNEIKGLQLGAVDYIRKPINIDSLRVRIEMHLELLRIQQLYEEKLNESSLTLDVIFDQAPIGIAISYCELPFDPSEDHEPLINPMFEQITGRTKEELAGLGWVKITHPDDRKEDLGKYQQIQAGEISSFSVEKRYIKPDGSIVWVNMIVAPLKLKNESKLSHICLIQDITERKEMERAIFESERSKAVLLSNLPGMAYRRIYRHAFTMEFVSQGCWDLTGYLPERLIGYNKVSFLDLIVPENRDQIRSAWENAFVQGVPLKNEYEIVTATGQRKWVLEMGQGIYNEQGSVEAIEGIIVDITDRKDYELKLKHVSEIDIVTGLYNRRYLENILGQDVLETSGNKRAIVLLALRRINSISLTYGYNFSENLVKELAASLAVLSHDKCKLFRISFERFAFYYQGYHTKEELADFCDSIIEIVSNVQIFHLEGCGIGVFELMERCCDADIIIRNAASAAELVGDTHMFGYHFFDAEMDAALKREADVKEELMHIANDWENNSLYLQYQPILDLKTGKITSFEALARIDSTDLGKVSPSEFIPLAEETQLIVPIGKQIIHMACGFMKKLEALNYGDIRVSVNVSAIQILREEFVDDLVAILEQHRVSPYNIGLEITESVFTGNFTTINNKLDQLNGLGFKVAIDDFGTGYSSLARERELNINCLKIDKYFVDKLLEISPENAISGDIISMAHKLGHCVVAEGLSMSSKNSI